MSKVSELALYVNELRSAVQSLNAVADGIVALFSGYDDAERSAPTPGPSVTLEQVRAVLADKSRAGKTEAVRELLGEYGADRLSAIDPARFPELLAAAEAL